MPLNKKEFEGQPCLPGMMSYMLESHIQILLSCLDLSYDAAIQFDSRPGLKFLIQKVAGIERAANLYRHAGAAWILKVVTLFDLSLHELKKSGATVDHVKKIIEDEESKLKQELDKDSNSSSSGKGDHIMSASSLDNVSNFNDMTTFLLRLQQSFDKLCDTYIDIVLDKDGTHSAVDRISDEPIFFLIAQTDDFPDMKWKDVSENVVKSVEDQLIDEDPERNKDDTNKIIDDNCDNSIRTEDKPLSDEHCKSSEKESRKPFTFADLVNQYNDTDIEGDIDNSRKRDSIYNVTGGSDVESLVEEYKRRKQLCSLPLSSQVEKRKNLFSINQKLSMEPPLVPTEPLPPEIEQQRKNSIIKVSFCCTWILIH